MLLVNTCVNPVSSVVVINSAMTTQRPPITHRQQYKRQCGTVSFKGTNTLRKRYGAEVCLTQDTIEIT